MLGNPRIYQLSLWTSPLAGISWMTFNGIFGHAGSQGSIILPTPFFFSLTNLPVCLLPCRLASYPSIAMTERPPYPLVPSQKHSFLLCNVFTHFISPLHTLCLTSLFFFPPLHVTFVHPFSLSFPVRSTCPNWRKKGIFWPFPSIPPGDVHALWKSDHLHCSHSWLLSLCPLAFFSCKNLSSILSSVVYLTPFVLFY